LIAHTASGEMALALQARLQDSHVAAEQRNAADVYAVNRRIVPARYEGAPGGFKAIHRRFSSIIRTIDGAAAPAGPGAAMAATDFALSADIGVRTSRYVTRTTAVAATEDFALSTDIGVRTSWHVTRTTAVKPLVTGEMFVPPAGRRSRASTLSPNASAPVGSQTTTSMPLGTIQVPALPGRVPPLIARPTDLVTAEPHPLARAAPSRPPRINAAQNSAGTMHVDTASRNIPLQNASVRAPLPQRPVPAPRLVHAGSPVPRNARAEKATSRPLEQVGEDPSRGPNFSDDHSNRALIPPAPDIRAIADRVHDVLLQRLQRDRRARGL
jgi:hypothetical protein